MKNRNKLKIRFISWWALVAGTRVFIQFRVWSFRRTIEARSIERFLAIWWGWHWAEKIKMVYISTQWSSCVIFSWSTQLPATCETHTQNFGVNFPLIPVHYKQHSLAPYKEINLKHW